MSDLKAYGYAVARIRAMEPLLLDQSVYQRLLDADGADGALKVLGETAYGKAMEGAKAGGRYDAALEAELLSTFGELEAFVPDKALVDIFRLPYDFHNVKVVLKSIFNARGGGKKRWDLMTALGTIPTEQLSVSIESEDYSFLPYGLSTVIPQCIAAWDQNHDIVEVERMLDSLMFATMLKFAETTGIPGVTAWIRARIDAENVRNLLRLRRFGYEAADAERFMHKGGVIPMMDLASLIAEPFENWSRMVSRSPIGDALAEVQDDGNFDRLIVDVEKALDDCCQAMLHKARYSPSAPENVLAYLWGKEQEMKNIRTIMVLKSGEQAGDDETRRLMRHGY